MSLYFCSQNRYILHELGSTSLNKSRLCFQPYVHYIQWNVQQIQKVEEWNEVTVKIQRVTERQHKIQV